MVHAGVDLSILAEARFMVIVRKHSDLDRRSRAQGAGTPVWGDFELTGKPMLATKILDYRLGLSASVMVTMTGEHVRPHPGREAGHAAEDANYHVSSLMAGRTLRARHRCWSPIGSMGQRPAPSNPL